MPRTVVIRMQVVCFLRIVVVAIIYRRIGRVDLWLLASIAFVSLTGIVMAHVSAVVGGVVVPINASHVSLMMTVHRASDAASVNLLDVNSVA